MRSPTAAGLALGFVAGCVVTLSVSLWTIHRVQSPPLSVSGWICSSSFGGPLHRENGRLVQTVPGLNYTIDRPGSDASKLRLCVNDVIISGEMR